MVKSTNYLRLELDLEVHGHRQQAWAYVDTGFSGYLIIPAALAPQLGTPDWTAGVQLGDGSLVQASGFYGTVEIIGLGDMIAARILALGSEFLIGRRVIDRYAVTFDHGQQVIVER